MEEAREKDARSHNRGYVISIKMSYALCSVRASAHGFSRA